MTREQWLVLAGIVTAWILSASFIAAALPLARVSIPVIFGLLGRYLSFGAEVCDLSAEQLVVVSAAIGCFASNLLVRLGAANGSDVFTSALHCGNVGP